MAICKLGAGVGKICIGLERGEEGPGRPGMDVVMAGGVCGIERWSWGLGWR